jgi:hypothetical protein
MGAVEAAAAAARGPGLDGPMTERREKPSAWTPDALEKIRAARAPKSRMVRNADGSTTYTVNNANVGQVIARNGALVAIRFMQAPNMGRLYDWSDGLFALIDDSQTGAVPKALFSDHIPTSSWKPANAIYSGEIMRGSILFTNLTLSHCPQGAAFELDVI